MSWKQTMVGAVVIALVAAAVVWMLEDFNRQRTVETMREEWMRWLSTLPMQQGEGGT